MSQLTPETLSGILQSKGMVGDGEPQPASSKRKQATGPRSYDATCTIDGSTITIELHGEAS